MPRHAGDVAGSFVLRLAVALQQRGVEVQIIAPGAPGLAAREQVDGVAITRVRYADDADMTLAYDGTMAEQVQRSWRARLTLVRLLFALRRATREALDAATRAQRPFALVHAHWWFPAGLALWRAMPRGRPPLVITMHGSDVRLAEHTTPAHPLMRAVLSRATRVTAVSSWLADTAQRLVQRPGAPIVIDVAPMPVEAARYDEGGAASRAAVGADRRGVLFVGRLNAQKGLRDLLDAMARLDSASGADLPLTIVGDGPDRAALQSLAQAQGLAPRITWLGTLAPDTIAALYRSAQVVVMPSRGEGLGLVAVEAQLCATPVIAYADAGLLDVVRPESGGTLVTPGDIAALADAIARVTTDRDHARRLGDAARAFVQAQFTPEAVADRYLSVYREALAGAADDEPATERSAP